LAANTGIIAYNTPGVTDASNVNQGSPSTGASVGNQPTRVSYQAPASVAPTVNQSGTASNPSDPALNYSPAGASLTPALAAPGAVGAGAASSSTVVSILTGAPIQTNFQGPAATPVTPQPTAAYDPPSATASGDVVDLLASASSDNADAGNSTFYHANHTAFNTPIHKGA
jgi:hypothetical protein